MSFGLIEVLHYLRETKSMTLWVEFSSLSQKERTQWTWKTQMWWPKMSVNRCWQSKGEILKGWRFPYYAPCPILSCSCEIQVFNILPCQTIPFSCHCSMPIAIWAWGHQVYRLCKKVVLSNSSKPQKSHQEQVSLLAKQLCVAYFWWVTKATTVIFLFQWVILKSSLELSWYQCWETVKIHKVLCKQVYTDQGVTWSCVGARARACARAREHTHKWDENKDLSWGNLSVWQMKARA